MTSWIPSTNPFIFTNFITDLIVSPLKSFLAMSCFLIGFLANAILIREAIEGTFLLLTSGKTRIGELFISYGVVGSFYLLFQINLWLTGIYFVFAFIYSLISLDFQRRRKYKNNL